MQAPDNVLEFATIYPLTRLILGEWKFDGLAALFAQQPISNAAGQDGDGDGAPFPIFLQQHDVQIEAVQAADFESLRDETARERLAVPLYLSDVHMMSEDEFMALRVCRHPAARLWRIPKGLSAVAPSFYPALGRGRTVLLTKRLSGVLVLPIEQAQADLIERLRRPARIVDLLLELNEARESRYPLKSICDAIEHEALIRAARLH